MALVIAQLTDLHLGADRAVADDPNAARLAMVLADVRGLRPDLLFVTGDLTQDGRVSDYRLLAAMLSDVSCPVHLALGNHDRRAGFAEAFSQVPMVGGHLQYAVEHPELRCLVLDTLEESSIGGAFCDARAAWLSTRLAEDQRATLILLHHPPVAVGIAGMDPSPGAGWVGRLRAALAPHRHVVALAAGHLHGGSVSNWHGVPVTVAPPVAPEFVLSLDPTAAGRQPGMADSAPGFALHRWDGGKLTTHFTGVRRPMIATRRSGGSLPGKTD